MSGGPPCEKLSKRASESGEAEIPVSRPFHGFLYMREIVRALGKIAEEFKIWARL